MPQIGIGCLQKDAPAQTSAPPDTQNPAVSTYKSDYRQGRIASVISRIDTSTPFGERLCPTSEASSLVLVLICVRKPCSLAASLDFSAAARVLVSLPKMPACPARASCALETILASLVGAGGDLVWVHTTLSFSSLRSYFVFRGSSAGLMYFMPHGPLVVSWSTVSSSK